MNKLWSLSALQMFIGNKAVLGLYNNKDSILCYSTKVNIQDTIHVHFSSMVMIVIVTSMNILLDLYLQKIWFHITFHGLEWSRHGCIYKNGRNEQICINTYHLSFLVWIHMWFHTKLNQIRYSVTIPKILLRMLKIRDSFNLQNSFVY